jgi:hypothetical protein
MTKRCPTPRNRFNWPGLSGRGRIGEFRACLVGISRRGAEKAIALNPNYPALYLGILDNAYRLSGYNEEAISAFRAYNAGLRVHCCSPPYRRLLLPSFQRIGHPPRCRISLRWQLDNFHRWDSHPLDRQLASLHSLSDIQIRTYL